MQKVEDIMTRDVITVKETDTLTEVAKTTRDNRIGGAPVLNEQGDVVGVISEADVLKILGDFSWYSSLSKILHLLEEHDIQQDVEKASNMKVKEVMSKNPKTVTPDTLISDAAMIMHSNGYNRLPVVDKSGNLLGIVTRADIVASLQEA